MEPLNRWYSCPIEQKYWSFGNKLIIFVKKRTRLLLTWRIFSANDDTKISNRSVIFLSALVVHNFFGKWTCNLKPVSKLPLAKKLRSKKWLEFVHSVNIEIQYISVRMAKEAWRNLHFRLNRFL